MSTIKETITIELEKKENESDEKARRRLYKILKLTLPPDSHIIYKSKKTNTQAHLATPKDDTKQAILQWYINDTIVFEIPCMAHLKTKMITSIENPTTPPVEIKTIQFSETLEKISRQNNLKTKLIFKDDETEHSCRNENSIIAYPAEFLYRPNQYAILYHHDTEYPCIVDMETRRLLKWLDDTKQPESDDCHTDSLIIKNSNQKLKINPDILQPCKRRFTTT